jgi:hypothetical protein
VTVAAAATGRIRKNNVITRPNLSDGASYLLNNTRSLMPKNSWSERHSGCTKNQVGMANTSGDNLH